jgi:hypothetical protein
MAALRDEAGFFGALRVARNGERPVGRERGAAMVELALVLPILLLVVFGIIEFGSAYNDAIALRQGVREAGRQGAVGNFGPAFTTGAPCHLTGVTGATNNVKNLMCLTKSQIGFDTNSIRVKVLSGRSDFSSAGTFAKTDSIIVCAQHALTPLTALISPFIGGKVLHAKASFRIEVSDLVATGGQDVVRTGAVQNREAEIARPGHQRHHRVNLARNPTIQFRAPIHRIHVRPQQMRVCRIPVWRRILAHRHSQRLVHRGVMVV